MEPDETSVSDTVPDKGTPARTAPGTPATFVESGPQSQPPVPSTQGEEATFDPVQRLRYLHQERRAEDERREHGRMEDEQDVGQQAPADEDEFDDRATLQMTFDWLKSDERRKAWRAILIFVGIPALFTLIVAALGYLFRVLTISGHHYLNFVYGGGAVTFLAAYISFPIYLGRRRRYLRAKRFEIEESRRPSGVRAFIDEALDTKAPVSADTSSTELQTAVLWADNVERLDRYHKLVTNQADSSYLMVQLAAAAGFLILLSAAIAAALAHTNLASGVAGGLGTLGAGIAAYIGRTFQRSYEQANNRLLNYFQQPLDLSRILISRMLLGEMTTPMAKDEAVLVIIEASMSGGKVFPEEFKSRRAKNADKALSRDRRIILPTS